MSRSSRTPSASAATSRTAASTRHRSGPAGSTSGWGTTTEYATRVEAHEALERFEKMTEGHEHAGGGGSNLARDAAVVVAVFAALLAVSTFLSNEMVKEVIV